MSEIPTPTEINTLAVAVDNALDELQVLANALVVACHQKDSADRRPPTYERGPTAVYAGVRSYLEKAISDRLARVARDATGFPPAHRLANNYPAPTE